MSTYIFVFLAKNKLKELHGVPLRNYLRNQLSSFIRLESFGDSLSFGEKPIIRERLLSSLFSPSCDLFHHLKL